MAQGNWTKKEAEGGFWSGVGVLLLLFLCPFLVIFFWHTLRNCDGSLQTSGGELFEAIWALQLRQYVFTIWPSAIDPEAWRLIGCFAAFELVLMRVVPGKQFVANPTSTGHRPVYKANGMQCYLLTLATYLLLVCTGHFDSYRVFDKMGEILSGLCLFSLLFVLLLVLKGLYFPSTADCGSSGSFMRDFFWGTELYPRFLGWDVKVFTNCRFGMMFWAVGPLCYAHHQLHAHGEVSNTLAVSIALQMIYCSKFFWWESGYMNTMDIQHDRAGYYLCWGCLVWVPALYASPAFYLAARAPRDMGDRNAYLLFLVGILAIWANYDCDRQRAHFRQTEGKRKIWGKPPVFVNAGYEDGKGGKKHSLLLASGWWGVSRHFHYLFEVSAAFCWSVPAGFERFAPYSYVTFLAILLLHRSFRDDTRCRSKYGKDWEKYCELVPYKVIPGIL